MKSSAVLLKLPSHKEVAVSTFQQHPYDMMLRTLCFSHVCKTACLNRMPLDRRKKQLKLLWISAILVFLSFICTTNAQNVSTVIVPCPEQCSCSYDEKVVNCSNRSLRRIPQHIPEWVALLTFRNNKVTQNEIKKKVFNNLFDLDELILSDNRLNHVDLSIRNAPKLRVLRFDRCSLDEVPDVTPSISSNITTLSLAHNSIKSLGRRLRTWSSLRYLNLSSNKLRHLRNNSFAHLTNLTELYLYRNKIVRVDLCAFAGLNHTLEILSLSRNKIQSLRHLSSSSIRDRPCTGQLSNLRFLDLSRNRISQIDGLTFNGMCRLHTLLLNNNRISTLMDGAFYSLKSLVYMKMDQNLIKRVKYSWLFDLQSLQTLSLFRNNISEIAPDSWKFCERTKNLNLSRNHLSNVPKGRFRRLTKLEQLDLSNNEIRVIDNDAFIELTSLVNLDLSFNRISSSVENIEGAFHGLTSLRTLSLRSNKILSLSPAVLRGVENLRQLDLRQNNVTSVQNDTFRATRQLRVLRMDSESFLCDCQLSWFAVWLRTSNRTNMTFDGDVRCFHPPDLKGQKVDQVDPALLECGDHPIPALLQQPNALTSYRGENVTLECSASATLTGGHSMLVQTRADMSVVWKRQPVEGEANADGNEVIRETKRLRIRNQQRRDGGHIFFTSLLLLYDVDYDDDKRYSCVISNAFGTVTSTQERLRVYTMPKINEKPVDHTVKNGSSVVFNCQATGHPRPVISWLKVGREEFHAAEESRLVHGGPKRPRKTGGPADALEGPSDEDEDGDDDDDDEGDVLLSSSRVRGGGLSPQGGPSGSKRRKKKKTEAAIVNGPLHFKVVLPRDAGEYRCTAKSDVGWRSASATLTVLYPPIIDNMPKELEAALGSNVVLQCMVQAYPEPRVKWFVDGKSLNRSARHFFAARDQLLVIVAAGSHDQGVYECEAKNELGKKRGETKLVLRPASELNGGDGAWAINGPKGKIIIAVFACVIVTSLAWLAVLCYTRKNPEGAFSTNTETTDIRAIDSSSHDSLDRAAASHHSRSCPNMANNSRADFPVHCPYYVDQHPPDLLQATPCGPVPLVTLPTPSHSMPRARSVRADLAAVPPPHRVHLQQGGAPVRLGGYDGGAYDRSCLSRPPLRAQSTSQVHQMQVEHRRRLPTHNSTLCIVDSPGGGGYRTVAAEPSRPKRRRRKKRAADADSHESAGGSSSRRAASCSSDSECERPSRATSSRQGLVWQKRTQPRGPTPPETQALLADACPLVPSDASQHCSPQTRRASSQRSLNAQATSRDLRRSASACSQRDATSSPLAPPPSVTNAACDAQPG